ncbi:hypothetical protein CPC08DRAFT_761371 [Agrocybe pediades]|nr:hypothetical protein CPC08DRAFT_761371 [Agrocybe pediades]
MTSVFSDRFTRLDRILPSKQTNKCPLIARLFSTAKTLKERSENHLRKEGLNFFRWTMWKGHHNPIETSNAAEWLSVPAYMVTPTRPVINDLPTEIMAKIFAYVVHSDSIEHKHHNSYHISRRIITGSSPTTPKHLMGVCPLWSDVVESTPTLWSTILVTSPARADVEEVSFILEKSKNCLLDLGLEQYHDPDPASLAILKLFFSVCHRWRSIRFTLKMKDVRDIVSVLRTQQPPQHLEEYRVRLETWDALDVNKVFHVLHSSPRLRNADWGGSLCWALRPDTPWSQLTELSLQFIHLSQEHLDALSTCQALATLRVHKILRIPSQETPPFIEITTRVILPTVRKFIVNDPTDHPRTFDAFTLPLLTDLEIYNRRWLHPSGLIPMSNMLRRSGSTLQSLALDGSNLSILSEDMSLFDDVHTLNVLSDLQDAELTLLAPAPSPLFLPEKKLLPKLRNLILHNYYAEDGTLSRVVSSRRHELEILQVCMPDVKAFPQDYRTLLWAELDGMSLTISGRVPDCPTYILNIERSNTDVDSDSSRMLYLPSFWEDIW